MESHELYNGQSTSNEGHAWFMSLGRLSPGDYTISQIRGKEGFINSLEGIPRYKELEIERVTVFLGFIDLFCEQFHLLG